MTLMAVLASDFAIFYIHRLQHRIPFLWEFHKVHHSAEVLTPMSVYRMHPVDDITIGLFVSLMTGLVYGVFAVVCVTPPNELMFFGLNIFIFLFYVLGFNLRHSHIWVPLRGWLGHIFISPAHHQIHHSNRPEHYDANFGFTFAFWDWMGGSLIIPEKYQKIEFGLGPEESPEYHSVWRLYTLPFRKAFSRKKPSLSEELV